jgi:hypothetical protein
LSETVTGPASTISAASRGAGGSPDAIILRYLRVTSPDFFAAKYAAP